MKRCPNCKLGKHIEQFRPMVGPVRMYQIGCQNCGCCAPPAMSEDLAIKQWDEWDSALTPAQTAEIGYPQNIERLNDAFSDLAKEKP